MKRWSLATISLIAGFLAIAQSDSTVVVDSTVSKARFVMPRLYWDYGKTAMLWHPQYSKTEVGIEFLFVDRIQIIAEGGFEQHQPEQAYKNVDYTSEGTFWKVGIGYLGYVDPQNRIGLGARYARSDFEDFGVVTIRSETGFNDDYEEFHKRDNLTAEWMEIVIDSERMISLNRSTPESILNRLFSMGLMIRYRILIDAPTFDPVDVFAIPGYGRRSNSRVLAFNLFLKVNF